MQPSLQPNQIKKFQQFVYHFFQENKRAFPWRETTDPYKILVSETMLQQTQTDRVVSKFEAFIQQFPTIRSLANASPSEVIKRWQGLGYNRRGLNLHRAAQEIVTQFESKIPPKTEDLESLPGIGPYTAAAIQAFAFNKPSIVIETNIRTVFIYHFFPNSKQKITDKALIPLIEQTQDTSQPRLWYSALMDYGAFLKKIVPNPSRNSKTYQKQPKFEGSNRQVRGKIIRLLTQQELLTHQDFKYHFEENHTEALQLADALIDEGFLEKNNKGYRLTQR